MRRSEGLLDSLAIDSTRRDDLLDTEVGKDDSLYTAAVGKLTPIGYKLAQKSDESLRRA